MRLWLVFMFLAGLALPAGAATMTTSISNTAFGSVHVGSAGAVTQTITINNTDTGGVAMTFDVVSDNPNYVAVPASGSIPPSGSQAVIVTFTPSARGARDATLTVLGSDGANPSDEFAVTGTGTSGNMVVTWTGAPGTLDFGATALTGGTSTRTITISNPAPANEALLVSLTISAGGTDFSAPTTMDVSVPVDGNAQVIVTFDPSMGGPRTGTATVTGNDPFNASDTVSLAGSGLVLSFSPTSLDFGTVLVGQSSQQTLTLTNSSGGPLQISGLAVGNTAFSAVPAMPLIVNMPANGTLEVTVTFTPVNGNILSTFLTVTTSATPSGYSIPVTGDGLYKDISIVATNEPDLMIDLGARRVGVLFTQTVTVTNVGETTQTLALPTSSAGACVVMPAQPSTLPAMLAPTEAATFEVRVTPVAVGAGTCTISVTTDIPSTDSILIDWQGVAPEVGLAAPTTPMINFGVIDVDATETFRTVVLENTGSAPLAVGPCTIAGSARFEVETSCANVSVAVGSSVTLMIGFDPTIEAAESATLTIGVDALTTQQVAIALSGIGADQRLDLSALGVSFPDTNVATDEAPIAYIDIFNPVNPSTGVAEPLHITSATSDNEVFTLANEGPFTVMGGEMIRLAITFHPQDAGTYDGTLTIASDASGQPMAAITLQGRGVVDAASEGGGCCETGNGDRNSLLALLVLGLLVRRRHSARWRR